jgi:RNA polymerase sigma-70 factor (ECF subfamily)
VIVTERGEASPDRLLPSFEEFYEAHYAGAVRLAVALVGRWDVAEELAQDAFVALHAHWSRISAYESPAGWIRRVLVNRAVSALRRRSIETRLLVRLANERHHERETAPADQDLWRLVAALPRRQGQVTALTYIEGLSVAEIATVLECEESTVRTHLRRARIALADRLGVEVEDEA